MLSLQDLEPLQDTGMSEAVTKRATYEDVLQAPPNLVAEIINGRLQTHPRPAPRHAVAASSLGGELVNPFQQGRGGPGGWWILGEPELHLGEHVLVPDLAGWRRERMPRIPETAWLELPPDCVCEILSPSKYLAICSLAQLVFISISYA